MRDLPFGTTDALSVDGWFASLTESLQELLGAQGAQAILSRALEDARRSWPQLRWVSMKSGGLDLSSLYSNYPSPHGNGYSLEGAVALRGLVDSLHLLLECLLGQQLTSDLMAWRDPALEEDQDDQQGGQPYDDCA